MINFAFFENPRITPATQGLFILPLFIRSIERGLVGLFDILDRCPRPVAKAPREEAAVPALSPDPARKEQP
jgi:hypothetical protein